jgi:SAM-dependent methyltransferase
MNSYYAAFYTYRHARIQHWNEIADRNKERPTFSRYYHQRLSNVYRFLVFPGQLVLEIGCGKGGLLASLRPQLGVGVDFSLRMVQDAREQHPDLEFICADAHELPLSTPFDVIILSDLVNDVWDVQTTFEQIKHLSHKRTRIIINVYSHLWEQPLELINKLGLAHPTLHQNWLTVDDLNDLFTLTDFDMLRSWQEVLWPLSTPGLATLANRYLVKIWPFQYLALSNFVIARPHVQPETFESTPRVSVIVAARNESGNITDIFERTPEMGSGTELVFVEGHSRDNTYEAIEQAAAQYAHRSSKLFRQAGKGKGDAVRLGFHQATGDVLMILDADLTMPPEDLPRYYDALLTGKGEFINGVRLVYPMEEEAMRFFNLIGNKFFSLAFSWLLGQSIKDTLCGTKVLWRADYEMIAANRAYFGDFDPFGDFDLLFGAAKLNLKIIDLPIRYRQRTYGATNIQRWRHGVLLLKMVMFASRRIKFV